MDNLEAQKAEVEETRTAFFYGTLQLYAILVPQN